MNDRWINEPNFKDLDVDLAIDEPGNDLILFTDKANDETVVVRLGDDFQSTNIMAWGTNGVCAVLFYQSKHFVKGEGIAERDVYHFITREHCKWLRVGLTIHRSAFSSTPHAFELSPEVGFEEAFFFLLPDGGKALLEGQGAWTDGTEVDAAWSVQHRQFAQVPMGWHRVVGLPLEDGVPPRLAYIWGYLARKDSWEKS